MLIVYVKYRYRKDGVLSDELEWDAEISDKEAERFLKLEAENADVFERIKQTEDKCDAEVKCQALEYSLLEKALPDKCAEIRQQLIEEDDELKEIIGDGAFIPENLIATGCVTFTHHIMTVDEEVEILRREGFSVYFSCKICYHNGRTDTYDDFSATLSFDQYVEFCHYRMDNGSNDIYKELCSLFPQWAAEVRSDMVDEVTAYFLECEDRAAFGVMNVGEDWKITEIADIEVTFVDLEETDINLFEYEQV